METKILGNFIGYTLYAQSEGGNMPLNVLVCRGGAPAQKHLRFWLANGTCVFDKIGSSMEVTKEEYNVILRYLVANRPELLEALYDFSMMNAIRAEKIQKMKLD